MSNQETDHQLLTNNDLTGRRLKIYSEDGTTYGIGLATSLEGITPSCGRGTSRCIGSSSIILSQFQNHVQTIE